MTMLRLSDPELESSYSHTPAITPAILLPCSSEPVATNDSSPRHFQSSVAQEPLIETCTKSWPTDCYVFDIIRGLEEMERNPWMSGTCFEVETATATALQQLPPPQSMSFLHLTVAD